MSSINSSLMKHNLLLGVDDRGKLSCHKVNLCFIYFESGECIVSLLSSLEFLPNHVYHKWKILRYNVCTTLFLFVEKTWKYSFWETRRKSKWNYSSFWPRSLSKRCRAGRWYRGRCGRKAASYFRPGPETRKGWKIILTLSPTVGKRLSSSSTRLGCWRSV